MRAESQEASRDEGPSSKQTVAHMYTTLVQDAQGPLGPGTRQPLQTANYLDYSKQVKVSTQGHLARRMSADIWASEMADAFN